MNNEYTKLRKSERVWIIGVGRLFEQKSKKISFVMSFTEVVYEDSRCNAEEKCENESQRATNSRRGSGVIERGN